MIARKIVLQNRDVNMFSVMRLSRLYEYLQEVSILDAEQLGAGEKATRDRGILWVVVQQRTEIARLPKYGEHVSISSWPGTCVHVLFPRYYEVKDDRGDVLVRGSALWALMDAGTRKVIFPERRNIAVPGEERSGQAPLPDQVKAQDTLQKRVFSVPFSWCDMNGHMNNTQYLRVAYDLIGVDYLKTHHLTKLSINYEKEVPAGACLDIAMKQDQDHFSFEGFVDHSCFLLEMSFEGQND